MYGGPVARTPQVAREINFVSLQRIRSDTIFARESQSPPQGTRTDPSACGAGCAS